MAKIAEVSGPSVGVPETVSLAAEFAAAFVSNNSIQLGDIDKLFAAAHQSILRLCGGSPAQEQAPVQAPAVQQLTSASTSEVVSTKPPAVDPKKSVTDEYIICLEDGMKLKSLKRYLWRVHQLTPEQYRLKWNLPMEYPMVAPSYSATRRALAKRMNLGRIPQTVAQEAPARAARTPKAAAPKAGGRARKQTVTA